MFKNYIKIAWRNLVKHKVDSAISIGGLALGIACCMLLILFIRFEWSFDTFHRQSNRMFRVVTEQTGPYGEKTFRAQTPAVLASTMEGHFPEVKTAVRLFQRGAQIKVDQSLVSEVILFADPDFFRVFSFSFIYGSPAQALSQPGNIVLSRRKALQLFGTTNAVGKTIAIKLWEDIRLYRVSGVAENPPVNSSITFEYVLPYEQALFTYQESIRKYFQQRWNFNMGETFVLLNEQNSAGQVEQKLPQLAEYYRADASDSSSFHFELQPLDQMYLNPEVKSRLIRQSNPLYSWVLGGIALIVLIIACINFMSLTLSRSSARAGEIGIRKAAGAQRSQLSLQFLGEAFLICSIAFVSGMIIAEMSLPYFREMVQKPIPFELFNDGILWVVMAGLILLSTLITGGYPAVVMSGKKISDAFKSNRIAARIPEFVKGLIVLQFTLSIAFVAAALVMHKQMTYITSKDLGFEEENVVLITPSVTEKDRYSIFEQEVRKLTGIEAVSATYNSYGSILFAHLKPNQHQTVEVAMTAIDEHFLETLKIDLIKGRNFSRSRPSDPQNGVLVNRMFVQSMGWSDPIGKVIPKVDEKDNSIIKGILKGRKVIGVIDDYHYHSLYNSLKPQILFHKDLFGSSAGLLWVKISDGKAAEALADMEAIWKEVGLKGPFSYHFLDDEIEQQYKDEQYWRKTVTLASGFAIALTCFGLFGLAALAAERRTKEIGIRRVLGATASSIVSLLSKDFIKPVVIGFAIATPVAWYTMNRWLQNFAYKTEIGPGIFALAGGAAILIALATVSWQSVRAALANPVESLRSE